MDDAELVDGVGVADPPKTKKRRRGPKPPTDAKTLPGGSQPEDWVGDRVVDLDRLGGALMEVKLELIDIPVQVRAINPDHVEQLAVSIQAHGLQSPITLYHNGALAEGKARFELGPGRHRLEAHRLLKLDTIRALVYPPASEAKIRLAQAIENLQRKDLTAIEEAEALAVIAEDCQGDVDQVASTTGQTKRWVEQRLSLLRLSPRVQALLLKGTIHLAHAFLLARLVSHDKQEEIAGRLSGLKVWGTKHVHPPEAVPKWRDAVEAELRSLAGVPWRLEVEFAGKCSCSGCPDNSANQPGLFDGDAPKKALCLNAECYAVKVKAASSAVIKSSNRLVQLTSDGETGAKPAAMSTKTAEAAMEARGVDFLEPRAVLERAKRALKPEKATRSEQIGARRQRHDWEIEGEFHSAHEQWSNELRKQIAANVRSDAYLIALWELINSTDCWEDHDEETFGVSKKAREQATKVMGRLLDLFGSRDPAALLTVAEHIKPGRYQEDKGLWPLNHRDLSSFALERLCKTFNIEMPPEPKLDEFKRAAKEQAKAKEPAKPAAAAKGATKRKKRKAKRKPKLKGGL